MAVSLREAIYFFSISSLPQLPTDVVQRFNECLISGAPTPEDDMKAPLTAATIEALSGLHDAAGENV